MMQGQTLVDIALRERGDWTEAWALGKANGMALSDEPEAGTELEVAERSIVGESEQVVREYRADGVEPASGVVEDFGGCGGVGRMCVGEDFEVS